MHRGQFDEEGLGSPHRIAMQGFDYPRSASESVRDPHRDASARSLELG
jgi:hypothetical protein